MLLEEFTANITSSCANSTISVGFSGGDGEYVAFNSVLACDSDQGVASKSQHSRKFLES